jgi:hypothetical protein
MKWAKCPNAGRIPQIASATEASRRRMVALAASRKLPLRWLRICVGGYLRTVINKSARNRKLPATAGSRLVVIKFPERLYQQVGEGVVELRTRIIRVWRSG